jgi:hypothetical protein
MSDAGSSSTSGRRRAISRRRRCSAIGSAPWPPKATTVVLLNVAYIDSVLLGAIVQASVATVRSGGIFSG